MDRANFDLAMRFQLSEYAQRLLSNKMLQCVRLGNEHAPVLFSIKMATLEIMAAAMERRQAALAQAGMFESKRVDGLRPLVPAALSQDTPLSPKLGGGGGGVGGGLPPGSQLACAHACHYMDHGCGRYLGCGGKGEGNSKGVAGGGVAKRVQQRSGEEEEAGDGHVSNVTCSRFAADSCGEDVKEKLQLLQDQVSEIQQELASMPEVVSRQVAEALSPLITVTAQSPIAPASPPGAHASPLPLQAPSARASHLTPAHISAQVVDLAGLLDRGLLSPEEFSALKKRLMGKLSAGEDGGGEEEAEGEGRGERVEHLSTR